MRTQIDLIKEAKRFYILHLNPGQKGMVDRYAIYADVGNGLEVLWPTGIDSDRPEKTEALPYQHYSKLKNYPPFHFKLSGCGYSKPYELRSMLAEVKYGNGSKAERVECFTLSGYMPSRA